MAKGTLLLLVGNIENKEYVVDSNEIQKSKESRISSLYRELVYHPFICHIHMNHYGWDGVGEVPDGLKACGWMDGWR